MLSLPRKASYLYLASEISQWCEINVWGRCPENENGGDYMKSNCEFCINYIYDEEYECMTCAIDLDEDEYAGFITGRARSCPYYRQGDEYTIVRKQI